MKRGQKTADKFKNRTLEKRKGAAPDLRALILDFYVGKAHPWMMLI